ncbi:pathogenesis-related protein PRMS isoform X2 [Amborella trichopoda]|uniref:pathogenesis-related protein PRMS isoform X2 n=1 Tax=Amborella trichopoda TaxID=13333 RepID=UPI0009BCD7E1|nr:pathogenesis-related protein PRMS isoform X2 [Amborella trichopoda]|eukprot:XP_020527834.1 pathogenesis-related protein PRMS isoform X2 [Amborella trichopoda]
MAHFRTTTTTTTTNSFSLLLPLSLLLILSLNTLIEAQLPPFIGNGRKANAREFLTHHNKVRIGMQEPPLVWDRTIAKYARRYAEHRRGDCQLIHSMGPYGENIFWGGGLDWRPVDAVRSWIDEHQFYNKTANACAPSKPGVLNRQDR